MAIVGGGFGGVGAAVMLRREGYEDVTVFEKGERVGGVWQHNTYPGAACDIPSHLYEFSFAPNRWSRRFSPGPEIRAYIEGVARRFGVLDKVRTGTEVTSASWDEERRRWRLQTSAGPHEADLLIAACGQLSVPQVPPIPGLDQFAGPAFHTAEWRHDVELAGRRVAVIGTGCSAIQVVPAIQPEVGQLDVYQRSPGWTLPKNDFAYSERARALFRRLPALRRLDRASIQAFQEFAAAAMTNRPWLLPLLRAIGRRQIKSAISDPELRRKLTPSDEIGCKRIMLTDDWYPALAQPNVELVDERIERVTATGIRSADGREREADAIVLATGFASHDFVAPMEIAGSGGRTLAEEWGQVPRAYLGLTVPGFPNMFLLYGPNTNGGSGSVVNTLECGIGHVLAALRQMEAAGAERIELRPEAAAAFDRELRAALAGTVWHSGCSNWYVDEDGNDPSNWPWLWSTYRRRTRELEPGAYQLA
ncbi:MAG TPA: NAD(P)/FAD-dependent oxidoreductase [Solirubrobacterales bacterium]|nr:NAD(P)/FAD-dependent oxidoreductase [Solirubrobacterales bacterium]